MTTKHFKAFAEALRIDLNSGVVDLKAIQYAASVFASVAKQHNSKFDRVKFFNAAGLLFPPKN